jgi:hypothetical protein
LGNKAKNLLENTPVIETSGCKVPKSLVIPYEYIALFGEDPYGFILNQIDTYFKGWKKVYIRSNASDEDLTVRKPGLYNSNTLRKNEVDSDLASEMIDSVLASYNTEEARDFRKRHNLHNGGMSLLIQDGVTNTPGETDANFSGCFTDLGELVLLTFTDWRHDSKAMENLPLKEYRLSREGVDIPGLDKDEKVIAEKLKTLTARLPACADKGWEIEFVAVNDGLHIVQTSRVSRKSRQFIDEEEAGRSIFAHKEVIGTDDITTTGILLAKEIRLGDCDEQLELLRAFNSRYAGYCVVTDHPNLNNRAIPFVNSLSRFSALIDIDIGYQKNALGAHFKQDIRESKILLSGELKREYYKQMSLDYTPPLLNFGSGLIYSPTRLRIRSDEFSRKAAVTLADGKLEPFVDVKELLK